MRIFVFKAWIPAFAGMTALAMVLVVPAFAGTTDRETFDPPKPLIVNVDVADIRSEPVAHNKTYDYDPKQETQVLKGERVLVFERRGDWVRVEAPNQQEFTHANKWQGYPGWIEERFLTDNLRKERMIVVPPPPSDDLRQRVLAQARRHLGSHYLWGGRSLHNEKFTNTVTGVDCSGLVNWSYERVGVRVPRDAHEQFMRARSIDESELKPADLIFYAKKDNPKKIVHVGLYVGNGKMLEAPQSGETVHETPVRHNNKERVVFFGTFFPKENLRGKP